MEYRVHMTAAGRRECGLKALEEVGTSARGARPRAEVVAEVCIREEEEVHEAVPR